MVRARVVAAVAILAALPAEGGFWGRDLNAAEGRRLIEEVRPKLREIVEAAPAARAARIETFAERAELYPEAFKRFRNPELEPLFLRLLDHPDWHTVHRALLALEHYGGAEVLARAWTHLFHSHPRIREKAAITCIKVWDPRARSRLSQGDVFGAIDAQIDLESDFHARKALEALRLRVEGKLPVQRVHEEFTVREEDGLLVVPFLDGMDGAAAVAPGYDAKGVSQGGGPSASKLPVADFWTTPLMDFGNEEVKGASLQPFGNPREGGRVHTGLDVGACFDGAGYYAAAAGVVKLVHSGSDMGTLLVLEHRLSEREVVCAVYMHGGDTVFVKGGDRVEAGRLLGSMGTSHSLENGGHYAHLHYGLYPGPFRSDHNHGYQKAADGLSDWYDPARKLPLWRDGNRPTEDEAPKGVVERAKRLRQRGHPTRAREVLEEGTKVLGKRPGAEALTSTLEAWKDDPAFRKALQGETALDRALAEAARLEGKKDAPARIAALREKLLEQYGDTDLAVRIREELRP